MYRYLKNKFFYLKGLKFVQDIFLLQIGSFFGVALAFIASVIYARILGAEIYGNYALIFAFAGIIGLFIDWGAGYTTLTLLSEAYARGDKEEMKNVITYFFKLDFIVFATVLLFSIIFAPQLSNIIYHQSAIGNLARLVLLAMAISPFFILLITMLQVLRKIKYLVVVENTNKLFLNFLPITFVLFGLGLWGIVLGHFLTAFGFMFFSLAVYQVFSKRNKLVPSLLEIVKNFRRVKIFKYFKFGFTVSIDKNISNIFPILPLIILGALATPEQVANLKIALAYLMLPNIFLGPIGRLLQVQFPKAKVSSQRDLKSNFYKSSLYTGFAFIFLTLVSLLFAPFLIKIFYGYEFRLSAALVYPLSLSTMFGGFMVGVGSIYRTLNKMKNSIIINTLNLISGLLLLVIARQFLSPLKSIVLVLVYWSVFSVIAHFSVITRILKEDNSNHVHSGGNST